jgi:AcrR family transcriptional regulator
MPELPADTPRDEICTRRSDARRNYRKLLDAATASVSADGTQASLREIARRAGVGLGTLYRHFPTRDALLEAVLGDALERLVARADDLALTEPPRTALITWLHEFTLGAAAFRGLPTSIAASLTNPGSALHGPCSRMTESLSRLIIGARREHAIRNDVTATDLLALAGAIATIHEANPATPQRLTHLLSIVVEGLDSPDVRATSDDSPARRDGHEAALDCPR